MSMENEIFEPGCYGEGALGFAYVSRKVFCMAEHYGFVCGEFEDEFLSEVVDEAVEYLNEKCPLDGHYWGFHDGDFGLWGDDSE